MLLMFLIKNFRTAFVVALLLPLTVNASFIESTIGAAVVDDATATYYNPAALTLLKNPQIITLGTIAYFHSQFTGQAIQAKTGFTQSGTTNSQTHYYLPSAYFGVPTTDKIFLGVAVIANSFNRDTEQNSVLRYVQSNNSIQNIDLVPAIGIKFNDRLSFGAGLNLSRANFLLKPTSGFSTLHIPDAQSRNESSGNAVGGDVGVLLKPISATVIGFNYRSSMTYRLSGKSVLEGNPDIISEHYFFNFWTPARYVLSINQFVNRTRGFIGTVQWVKWDIFDKINIHGIATKIGTQSIIIPNATVPYHLHNSWVFTLGSHYRMTPKWVIRAASSYLQSPGNGNYQITNGDSIILGTSMGYEIFKHFVIDGSYAHAFIKNKNINITSGRNTINGINKGFRDSISLKLTFNL
ncbi:outer membrane protein transport protein [soil metagenome]